jgi:hypothetical protein
MMLGMSFSTFTTVHVIISLIAIFAGFIVLSGMFKAEKPGNWTALFLVTTVLTSVTGFFFPFGDLLPSHIVGIVSLAVLAVAILAFYIYHLARSWRWIYVACAIAALYFNVFVLAAQAFQKLPFLEPLAPTQSEPPFLAAQGLLLVVFIALGIAAARSFYPGKAAAFNPE